MKLNKYIIPLLSLAAFALAACTNDNASDATVPVIPGESEVRLSGILPTVGQINESAIYLIAVLDTARSEQYITETAIVSQSGLDATEQEFTFTSGSPYYPLGRNVIRFFAYTGTADTNGNMTLRAGNTGSSDAVLSNYGRRESDSSANASYEGTGTPGSSDDPAELLQFRHVMTQLVVNIVVDSTETPAYVDPPPTNVTFTLDSIVAQGYYPITALAPAAGSEGTAQIAENTSGEYQIKEGINYLIPNGATLSGKQFNTLIIDDYTATSGDLAGFTIEADAGNTANMLLPGYSYNLTITVRRLKVVSVTLTQIPWVAREIEDGEINYDPNTLSLELGDYVNSGTDQITKVVIRTSDNKLYVGGVEDNSSDIAFVTLPTTSVEYVELYTSKGLLISTEDNVVYSSNTLTIPLSEGGMFTEDPSQPYSATNPYIISTPVQFLNVSKNLTASYKQDANIDHEALLGDENEIFNGFDNFSGRYDGNGHWIANIEITGSGLFKENSGVIRNVRLFSGSIDASGTQYAGSIAGSNSGTIVACLNEVYIANADNYAGGITGQNSGRIVACVNTGNIWEGNYVGGICGYNSSTAEGAIEACINTGALNTEATGLGGICGLSVNSSNNVVRTSFWLVGTAQRHIGGGEVAVGSGTVGILDATDLGPDKMRNGLNDGETESQRILNRLNTELANDIDNWGDVYKYIYDNAETGITWPAPVIK
ncbi:MAG: fimbrillin family protein [Rikenellaceae bacterium]|nr:fimbrillin family protein [Rikenellaceae bacterium]